MRIAMTVGRSFVGKALLARLVKDEHEVVVIGPQHGSGAARPALRGEARLVLLADDIGVDRIALRAMRGIASHIVYGSSTSVYGRPERVPIVETDRTLPLDPHARAKLLGECVVRRAARRSGITATILRYATVYGPGEIPAGLVRSFVRAAVDGTAPQIEGDGLDEDDYVYVDDAVEATVRAIERGADSTYNVGTGIGTSSLTLARAVLHLAEVDAEPVFGPRLRAERARIVCSTARAVNDLGFTAWPYLHYGLQNEIAWMRGNAERLNDISIDRAQSGSS